MKEEAQAGVKPDKRTIGGIHMNLIKKKSLQKNIKSIQRTNYDSIQFLEYLKKNHSFTHEEIENLKLVEQHLINMNVVFDNYLKALNQ